MPLPATMFETFGNQSATLDEDNTAHNGDCVLL